MVTVVCSPSECQFRQVTGTYDESVLLIGQIHQNLRALTGLTVFIRHIMDIDIVVDILEVLYAGITDAYLAPGDSQFRHQTHGIGMGAVGSTEAWHGDTYNALAVIA